MNITEERLEALGWIRQNDMRGTFFTNGNNVLLNINNEWVPGTLINGEPVIPNPPLVIRTIDELNRLQND